MNRARFLENNILTETELTIEKSSGDFSKSLTDIRAERWVTTGIFELTDKKIYINDGSDKDIDLTNGTYTGLTLAAHIQTQLNASSSNWTCTYLNKLFTIANTASLTLRISESTNAIWDIIGLIGTVDRTNTTFIADQTRIHTSEWFKIDLLSLRNVKAVCLLGNAGELLKLSEDAVVKVKADNLDNFETPEYEATLELNDHSAFLFLDETFRYWKIEIFDKEATTYPEFSYCYLGDYFQLEQTNIAKGFDKTGIDRTSVIRSINGTAYFNEGLLTSSFGLQINLMSKTDRENLERTYYKVRKSKAFVLSIDPDVATSISRDDWTKLVRFEDAPKFSHIYCAYMASNFTVEEVI